MKFEVGKAYKTRDGRKAVFAGDMRDYGACGPLPLRFVIEGAVQAYCADGTPRAFGAFLDIVSEWREPIKIVIEAYYSADLARRAGHTNAITENQLTTDDVKVRVTIEEVAE